MKTAAKVFIIIGMVLGFANIYPIVLGIIALKKLEDVDEKDGYTNDVIIWGILTLAFVSRIGGIFYLLIPTNTLSSSSAKDDKVVDAEAKEVKKTSQSFIDRIKELKELYDCGAITEEEFNQLKAEEFKNR